MKLTLTHIFLFFAAAAVIGFGAAQAYANPALWQHQWPKTNFSKTSIDYSEIMDGGPGKDGIPAIDTPQFRSIKGYGNLTETEPVIGLVINGDARAYPLQVLMWHEIVNDTVGGMPVAVTYCPLCNASMVFDRRVGDKVLDFGTTGKLRYSDMVMYDRQTESWWQQFIGQGIVGELTGVTLKAVPSRLISFGQFKKDHPEAKVLVPNNERLRAYGKNPYVNYIHSKSPFLYRGKYTLPLPPLAHVVTVGSHAWPLEKLRNMREIRFESLIIRWQAGQNSALDTASTGQGLDVGNITVQRQEGSRLVDVPYYLTFAFAFNAFMPNGTLHP